MNTIGKKVREIRRSRLLTQIELANDAKMSVQALRALESGRSTNPRRATISKLAEVLCVDPLDLADTSLTTGQCLRRAERSGLAEPCHEDRRRTLGMVASLTPYPLAFAMLAIQVGPLF